MRRHTALNPSGGDLFRYGAPMPFPRSTLAGPIALLLALPVTAHADRPPTKRERVDVAQAIGVPKRCLRTRISTVNERWSRTTIRNEKASCQEHAGDGVAVFKRRGGKWRFVTAGSSFDCPVPDVPRRIAKDLEIPCEPR
jgi:hypothetical protein